MKCALLFATLSRYVVRTFVPFPACSNIPFNIINNNKDWKRKKEADCFVAHNGERKRQFLISFRLLSHLRYFGTHSICAATFTAPSVTNDQFGT